MRAVIGQFSGQYSPVRTAEFKFGFVAKLCCGLSASVINFHRR